MRILKQGVRRFFSALTVLVMVLSLVPATVFAAETSLKIAGQQIANGETITCGSGTAAYQNGVLTLTDAGIQGSIEFTGGDLTVVLEGDNKVTGGAIKGSGHHLTLTGTGSVAFNQQKQSEYDRFNASLRAGNITIDGCTVTDRSQSCGGILADSNLTIQNYATVDIQLGGYEDNNCPGQSLDAGRTGNGNIVIDNSNVYLKGRVMLYAGTLTIRGGEETCVELVSVRNTYVVGVDQITVEPEDGAIFDVYRITRTYGDWEQLFGTPCKATSTRENPDIGNRFSCKKHEHQYDGTATCIYQPTCDCGDKKPLDPNKHMHTELRNQKEATKEEKGYTGDLVCTDCGSTLEEGQVLSYNCDEMGTPHEPDYSKGRPISNDDENWTMKLDKHELLCRICGEPTGVYADHRINGWVVLKEAGPHTPGLGYYNCSICGYAMPWEEPRETTPTHWEFEYPETVYDETDHWYVWPCGYVEAKENHRFEDWEVIKEATEEEEGLRQSPCYLAPECPYVKIETIPKLVHTHSLKEGYQSDETGHWQECENCDEQVDFAGHTYDAGTVTTAATCTSAGVKTYTCTACGYEKTEEIPQLAHTWETGYQYDETNHWQACTGCDARQNEAAHAFVYITDREAAEFTAGSKHEECTVCGYAKDPVEIPATHTHSYGGWVSDETGHWKECGCGGKIEEAAHHFAWITDRETAEFTAGSKHEECTVCGYKKDPVEIPATHTHSYGGWVSDETNHWKECACGGKTEEAAHAYGGWTVTVEATEEAAGSQEHTCMTCGYTETQEIPQKEHVHQYGVWQHDDTNHWKECACGDVVDEGPHALAGGVCEICGYGCEHLTTELRGDKTASCTSAGYTGDTVCTACGVTVIMGGEIPMLPHTYGQWETTEEPGEYTSGERARTCTSCNHVETEVIPAYGHSHYFGRVWQMSTSFHWKECACGEIAREGAHEFEWVTDEEATEFTAGSKHEECTICGYAKEAVEIPAAHSHSYDTWAFDEVDHWKECACGERTGQAAHEFQWIIDKDPTELEEGSRHEECAGCGYAKEAEAILKLEPEEPPLDNTPKTGDGRAWALWLLLAAASAGGALALLRGRKRG